MAVTYTGSTIVCDAGPNTIQGPIEIINIQCSGAVTIKKGATTIFTFSAGTQKIQFRSSGPIIVTGACTLTLRLTRNE